jgi:hypothetical protein
MKRIIIVYRTTEDATGIDLTGGDSGDGTESSDTTEDTGADAGDSTDDSGDGGGDGDSGGSDDAGSDDGVSDKDDEGEADPITYEIPEGLEDVFDDQETFDEATEFAKSIGLTQEQFASTFQYLMDNVGSSFQENIDEYKEHNQQGLNTMREELGATAYDKTMTDAARVVNAVGSQEFVDLLAKTDLGNNPVMATFLGKLGSLLSEDGLSMVGGQEEVRPAPNAAGGDDALAKKFYPNMK